MEQNQNIMPHSLEAERSVLGCMMLDPQASYVVRETLEADDFFSSANKEIYKAMCELMMARKPVDFVTVVDEIYRRGTMEGIGGIQYLTELSTFVPTTANLSAYVRIVEEKSTMRRLIEASQIITKESYNGEKDLQELLNLSEKLIFNISMKRAGEALTHIHPTLLKVYDNIEELYLNKGQIMGVPTGYTALDDLTTGLHGGEFVLIGGRPSMGKSSLAMNIVEYASIKQGKKSAVFSLEMPKEQIVQRLLCSYSFVNMQKVRQGNLTEEDWEKLADSLGPVSAAPIYLDDTSSISVPEIRSRCRRLQMEHGLDLVVIDYLQLMSSSRRRSESRQSEISEISRMLKGLAQELHVPVIAAAQLSRTPQGRADHRPVLSDIRESGSIEQDADVVMFIYRDEYYNKESEEKNIAEIIIAKQRNGPLGTVKLAWLGEYTKFAPLPKEYEQF
ncbi:MAG: replicative DNA helicase [Christensenellales bacterium]|jgi:replicative DNA helicase